MEAVNNLICANCGKPFTRRTASVNEDLNRRSQTNHYCSANVQRARSASALSHKGDLSAMSATLHPDISRAARAGHVLFSPVRRDLQEQKREQERRGHMLPEVRRAEVPQWVYVPKLPR
jgi:hypothetical protein